MNDRFPGNLQGQRNVNGYTLRIDTEERIKWLKKQLASAEGWKAELKTLEKVLEVFGGPVEPA